MSWFQYTVVHYYARICSSCEDRKTSRLNGAGYSYFADSHLNALIHWHLLNAFVLFKAVVWERQCVATWLCHRIAIVCKKKEAINVIWDKRFQAPPTLNWHWKLIYIMSSLVSDLMYNFMWVLVSGKKYAMFSYWSILWFLKITKSMTSEGRCVLQCFKTLFRSTAGRIGTYLYSFKYES